MPFKQLNLERRRPPSVEDFFSIGAAGLNLRKGDLQSPVFVPGKTGWRLRQNLAEFYDIKIGARFISIDPGQSIQAAIDTISGSESGGEVFLRNGTHPLTDNLVIPNNITLKGQSRQGAILDFGGLSKQIQIIGSAAYSTGTLSVTNNSQAVTGVGTAWLANATIGQGILLAGTWYPIEAIGNDTGITIGIPFAGNDLSGATYNIATTVSGFNLTRFTVQNSAIAGIKLQYGNEGFLENTDTLTCDSPLDIDDSSNVTLGNNNIVACNDPGTLDNFHFFEFNATGLVDTLVGNALNLNGCTNASLFNAFALNAAADGFNLTDCDKINFLASLAKQNAGQGIELVSGNTNINIASCGLISNGSDGIKLTATSDRCLMNGNVIEDNGGWGINIANANCDANVIDANSYNGNTSGEVSDSGTGTINDRDAAVAEWVKVTDTTLGSAASSIGSGTITAYRYFKVLLIGSGVSASAGTSIRFNDDTGSNYAYRTDRNATSENLSSGDTQMRLDGGADAVAPSYTIDIAVDASQNKSVTWIGGTAAGGNPERDTGFGIWENTSDKITQIDIQRTSGNLNSGTRLVIYGATTI